MFKSKVLVVAAISVMTALSFVGCKKADTVDSVSGQGDFAEITVSYNDFKGTYLSNLENFGVVEVSSMNDFYDLDKELKATYNETKDALYNLFVEGQTGLSDVYTEKSIGYSGNAEALQKLDQDLEASIDLFESADHEYTEAVEDLYKPLTKKMASLKKRVKAAEDKALMNAAAGN